MVYVKAGQSLTLPLTSLQTFLRFWGPYLLVRESLYTKHGHIILRYLCVLGKAPWQGVSWGDLPIRYIRS
jgi:hypothetical protein